MSRGGLVQNLDIQTAVERIRAAQAQLDGTGSSTQLTGSASAQIQRSGGDLIATDTTSSGTANAAYVFDLFGNTDPIDAFREPDHPQ